MILIAIPTYETVWPETIESIWDMAQGRDDVSLKLLRGYTADHARNKIARHALDGGYSHVLMVDSDTVVPANALDRLLSHGADIALGCYPRNCKTPGMTAVCKPGNSYKHSYTVADLDEAVAAGKETLGIRGGGLGCALIDTRVFRKIDYPWFKWVEFPNGEHLGEDLYFCTEARKANLRLLADPHVRCKHMIRREESL